MPLLTGNKAPSDIGNKKECCDGGICKGGCCCANGGFAKKIMLTFIGILLVYLIFFVGTLVRNNLKKYDYIGQLDRSESTVYVTGIGRVSGNNDIAVTTIGYSNLDKDVAKAQADNKKVMDKILAELKTMGVAENDLQTNYTIYPEYEYLTDRGSILKGYRVSNQLTIKIRDLNKINEVLALAGKYGATEISGLNFTVDDPANLKMQARAKAVADAKVRAAYLAQSLGVRLGRIVSFTEYENNSYDYPIALAKSNFMGMGAEGGGGTPDVATGSKDVVMNVNVTYEILP